MEENVWISGEECKYMHLAMLGDQDCSGGRLRGSRNPGGPTPSLPEVSAGFPEQQRVPRAAEAICFPIRFMAEKRPFTHRRLSRVRTSHPWNCLCGESIVSRKSLKENASCGRGAMSKVQRWPYIAGEGNRRSGWGSRVQRNKWRSEEASGS